MVELNRADSRDTTGAVAPASHPAASPPLVLTTDPASLHSDFATRLRRMRSRRYEEWFHIVFAGPVGTMLAAVVAEVQWVTPNLLTALSFVGRLACCWLIVHGGTTADLTAAALIQATLILDVMDGSLARYRRLSSYFGGFFDKVTDSIALTALLVAAGYRVFLDTGKVEPLLLAFLIAFIFVARAHMFWLTNHFELERRPDRTPATPLPSPGEMSGGERLRYYLESSYRIFAVMAAEVYLGLSVGLVLDELDWTLYLLAPPIAVWYLVILVVRVRQVRALDRRTRDAT